MELNRRNILVATFLAGLLGMSSSHAFTLESLPSKDDSNLYYNVKNGVATLYGVPGLKLKKKLANSQIDTNRDLGTFKELQFNE